MFWRTVLSASMLAASAQAGYEAMSIENLLPRDLERRVEYFDENQDQPAHIITKRQTGGVVMNSNGTINMTAWDTLANEKCTQALLKLPAATNPTGACVCYNLPALNNITGTFEADLRLYQLTAPSGDFAGVPQSNIQVSLAYQGASVAPIQSSQATQRVSKRQDGQRQLRLLQTYMFAGQIDKNRMDAQMNMAAIEALVMPVVTLSAVNPTGQTVSTNVSSNEAAFVAGVFSESTVMSEFGVANMAVDKSLEMLANGTIAFVLPGVSIMIFPVGLIVTSIWTVGLCGAIAFGTFNRIGFREQFRRRTQYAGKTNMGRI
ncbi:hypothetical protein MCOR27_009189 [Pyricularia oryzae]|uniref:Uncharacterized protein n=1 Tax=Pyricularia grisea TaxID=148305 RepID=A0ABQ8NC94_PYRGI|nr:hypothetical protein MCOR01_003583 [Pyricularia oryzae]KAI6294825.1 hypothetical protein MCOR33_008152 [Pyricularia grisea]KAI6255471.1 hypothetical protein MCOR19_008033 [Pyricularia oryzae]KAI6270675.1 hypothetical protein MCOR27_009189 [Pyricularia oryzae]KAI6307036.1 hypothetical protein MCOR29_009843 [Pyricularia oryzae]